MSSMKKRGAEESGAGLKRRANAGADAEEEHKGEELVFEDPFGDDLEDEDMVESDGDEDEDGDGGGAHKEDVDMDGEEQPEPAKKVFMPGVDTLGEDEVLDYDASAYDMYYAMTAEWPSLSIDVVRDNLGAVRTRVRPCVVE